MNVAYRLASFVCAVSALLATNAAIAAGDEVRGKMLYGTLCIACHSVDYDGVGPAHRGVFGRRAGSRPNYEYSLALRHAQITWTAQNLDRWLAGPEQMIPGQKMGFSVANESDRADLIEYLKGLSEPAPPPR